MKQKTAVGSFAEWLDLAVSGLSFPSDRKRARAELRDHLQDRYDCYRSRGLSFDEATRKALEAMGDPRETKELLREVHKRNTRLTTAVRLALAALLILALFVFTPLGKLVRRQIRFHQTLAEAESYDYRPVNASFNPEAYELRAWREGSCDKLYRMGDYELRVDYAASTCRVLKSELSGAGGYRVRPLTWVVLRFAAPIWSQPDFTSLKQSVYAVDDLGREYLPQERWGSASGASRGAGMYDYAGLCTLDYLGSSLRAHYYAVNIGAAATDVYATDDPDLLELHLRLGETEAVIPVRFGSRSVKRGAPAAADEDALLEEMLRQLQQYEGEFCAKGQGRAEAVQLGQIEASIPWAQACSVSEEEAPGELQLVLMLRGAENQMPLTDVELLTRLSMTDDAGQSCPPAGSRLPLRRWEGDAWDRGVRFVSYEKQGDLSMYTLRVAIPELRELYRLRLALYGGELELELRMEEEVP